MIKLIVGLGNPGAQYEKTRHNIGFVFLNRLANQASLVWKSSGQFQGEIAPYVYKENDLILLKPQTFMNNSGMSVGKVMRYYKIEPNELLVVHDELDLPQGMLKFKQDGGHAGHNGLRDIIAHINSRDFYRLRVGIGRPSPGSNVADYVLAKPSKADEVLLDMAGQLMIDELAMLLTADVGKVNSFFAAKN
jgi:PTH1 family peptidyl-tRNA hydrolase